MSFVNKYRSTTIYGELKVQKYNTGGVTGLLDISGNTILRGDVGINGNLYADDGTVDISGNLTVSGDISGNFTGSIANATNAVNTGITGNTTNASFYPTFVSGATGYLPHYVDTDFNYNPSTNTLTVPNISGNLSGNVTGNLTGTSSSVNVTVDGTNTTYRIPFLSATSGSANIYSDAQLLYNPSTNVLVATGGFAGNASTATDADNATNITVAVSTANQEFHPTFVSTTTGNLPPKVDTNFTYNPSTNVLTVPNITGTCSSATNADIASQVSVSTTGAGTRYISMFAGSGTRTCLIDADLTFDVASNTLTCTNITGTCSNATDAVNATNSTNVAIATDATNATFYPTFVSTTTGNLPAKVDSDLNYNPSTNTLTCTNITGTCSNATNATNSTNVAIATDATNASFYPTFVSTTTGNLPLKVDGGITYNPSTNLLTTTVSSVNVTSVSTDADYRVPFLATTTGSSTVSSDGGIVYNPSTNLLTTTVSSVNVTAVSTDANYRIPFLATTTGSSTVSSDGGITFNPSNNTLNVSRINSSYVGGVWLIDGTNTGTFNAAIPLFTSQTNLADINDQSSLTFTRQTTDYATGGSYLNPFDNFDKIDTIIVFPNWGIVGFVDSNYNAAGGILINYKNIYDFPVFVNVTDNQMSSCLIYRNDVEQ